MSAPFFLRITLLSLVGILSSCATLKDDHCATSDWFHIGETDASRLRPPEYLLRHQDVCGAARVSAEDYQKGYDSGLQRLCTPNDAFTFGYLGKFPNEKCKKDPTLDEAYQQGSAFSKSRSEASSLATQRNAELEREKIEDAKPAKHSVGGVLRTLFANEGQRDSERTLISLQKVESSQEMIRRRYEGAIIYAEHMAELGRQYGYAAVTESPKPSKP